MRSRTFIALFLAVVLVDEAHERVHGHDVRRHLLRFEHLGALDFALQRQQQVTVAESATRGDQPLEALEVVGAHEDGGSLNSLRCCCRGHEDLLPKMQMRSPSGQRREGLGAVPGAPLQAEGTAVGVAST